MADKTRTRESESFLVCEPQSQEEDYVDKEFENHESDVLNVEPDESISSIMTERRDKSNNESTKFE